MHAQTEVPGCKETLVEALAEEPGLHVLRVEVGVGGEIPLHTHECAATMVIVGGSALALGSRERRVSKGDVIVKAPHEPHGFSHVEAPFTFISISDGDGIQQRTGWDISFAE